MAIGPSTSKNRNEDSEIPKPPDGGWGWAVVFGSFMIHIVTDGVTYSFGVFYDEFLTYFNEGKGPTAWIVSILVGMTLCSGPISSAFINRWGCRVVTIIGAIVCSICLILSCFAKNVTTLYFTVGFGAGSGFGLIYLPAIVSVSMYFEKRRSLATGIAVCGSGFGTFIFAPIINLLLAEYGWRGSMLIIAALILECIIFGALFRPLVYTVPADDDKIEMENLGYITFKAPPTSNLEVVEEQPEIVANEVAQDTKKPKPPVRRHMSTTTKPTAGLEKTISFPNDPSKLTTTRLVASQPVLATTPYRTRRNPDDEGQQIKIVKPLSRPDIFYQGSLLNLASGSMSRSASRVKQDENEDLLRRQNSIISRSSRYSSVHAEEKPSTSCGSLFCSEETNETLKQMLDLSLFKNPIFLLFLLSNFFTSIGFYVPYVYIVSKAKFIGLSSDRASMLLSVIGIANTVGRLVLGYISDNPKVNRLWVYNLSLMIAGFSTTFSSFCLDFYSLVVYCALFGFSIGANVGLTSVLAVDLLGLENLTSAFGLLLLFQGIASLIGPPIAGELYDQLNSYDPGFYLAGVMIAASGFILFAIPPIQKWQTRKEIRKAASIDM